VFCCLRSEICLGMKRPTLRRAMDCCWPLVLILIVLTFQCLWSDSRGWYGVERRKSAYVSNNRR
jgi:hypothetical protein